MTNNDVFKIIMRFFYFLLFFPFCQLFESAQSSSFPDQPNPPGVARPCKEKERPCVTLPPGERFCNLQANEMPCVVIINSGQFVPPGQMPCGFGERPCVAVQQGQKICRKGERPCTGVPQSLEKIHRCVSDGFKAARVLIYQCLSKNHDKYLACLSKAYEASQVQQADSSPENLEGEPVCQANDTRCIYLQCMQRKAIMREACMKEAYRSEQTALINCARDCGISVDCAHPRGICADSSQWPISQGGPNSP